MLMLLTLVKPRKRCLIFRFHSSLSRSSFSFLFFLFLNLSKWVSLHDRYSMVLAENVDGGDDLDLIVTTMNGNVFCFSTPAPHHPLKVG